MYKCNSDTNIPSNYTPKTTESISLSSMLFIQDPFFYIEKQLHKKATLTLNVKGVMFSIFAVYSFEALSFLRQMCSVGNIQTTVKLKCHISH